MWFFFFFVSLIVPNFFFYFCHSVEGKLSAFSHEGLNISSSDLSTEKYKSTISPSARFLVLNNF